MDRPTDDEFITLKVFTQDPQSTPEPVPVTVRRGIKPGPVGSRVAVYDYNRDRDEVYPGARPRDDGSFPDYEPTDLRFHQLNAYAITSRAIELAETELGRDIRWGFDASRLIVLPHAGYMANAFYSEDTHSLQFYSFLQEDSSDVFHTSLSHDVVSHETGHAILDAVRDRFTESLEPETAALHEAVGDLTTIFAALSHRSVLAAAAENLAEANFISQIAEHFMENHHPLRDLLHEPQPDSFWEVQTSPHARSLRLTCAVYDALRTMHESTIGREGKDRNGALRLARRALQRMVVRGLDYLPPADATFADYARAILHADAFANETDMMGFRRIVGEKMVEHGILAGPDPPPVVRRRGRRWDHLPRGWPRPTIGDAYLFLDKNRRRLALSTFPDFRDFVVRDLLLTTPPMYRDDTREVDQVILVYEYPVEFQLTGKQFGPAEGLWLTVRGGGTLVFDDEGCERHHARKPVTADRIASIRRFLGSGIGNGRVQPVVPSPDDDLRRHHFMEPWMLALSPDEAVLQTNPAARCRPPSEHPGGGR